MGALEMWRQRLQQSYMYARIQQLSLMPCDNQLTHGPRPSYYAQDNSISDAPFSREVLASLAAFGCDVRGGGGAGSSWKIPDDEISKRRDLRAYRIFTIDPWSARDLDDALHITVR